MIPGLLDGPASARSEEGIAVMFEEVDREFVRAAVTGSGDILFIERQGPNGNPA